MIFRLILIFLLLGSNAFATPNIVVSIKPIHSIVSALTHGVTEPKLLLDTGQSAHHTHLKPSQLSLLNQADLVIFIHPTFEGGFDKVFSSLKHNKKLIIGNTKGIHLIRPEEDHEDEKHGEDEGTNYHLWLDIANMQIFAKTLSSKLSQIDSNNQSIYANNLNQLIKKLDKLKQTIQQQLSKYQQKPIAGYSNAFVYFMHANQLTQSTTVNNQHGENLSIYKILAAKQTIKDTQTTCLIATPEIQQKRINTLKEGLSIKSATIDIIGLDLSPGSSLYFELMQNISNNINQCLK